MEYTDINELRNDWLSGNFEYPAEVNVDGIAFKRRSSSEQNFEDIIVNKKKAYVIYQTSIAHRDEAKEKGMHQWLVFIWGADPTSVVRPNDIRSVSPQRAMGQMNEKHELIGDVAILKIFLPSTTAALKGRVDTGAEISSLNADKFEIADGMVKFINKDISNNVISVPLAQQQAVKSADGGVEYRPVIELDIEVNGKPIRKALFNLNNRNHMEYPCLIGQNVLQKTNFLIDPKMNSTAKDTGMQEDEWFEDEWLIPEAEDLDVNFSALDELFEGIEPVVLESEDQTKSLDELYKLLEASDITLKDLVRYIRTDTLNTFEDIEY